MTCSKVKGELTQFSSWGQIQVPSIKRRFKGTYVLCATSSRQEKRRKKGACWVSEGDDVIGAKPHAHATGLDAVAYGFERIRVVLLCAVFDLTVLSQSTDLRSVTLTQLKTLTAMAADRSPVKICLMRTKIELEKLLGAAATGVL